MSCRAINLSGHILWCVDCRVCHQPLPAGRQRTENSYQFQSRFSTSSRFPFSITVCPYKRYTFPPVYQGHFRGRTHGLNILFSAFVGRSLSLLLFFLEFPQSSWNGFICTFYRFFLVIPCSDPTNNTGRIKHWLLFFIRTLTLQTAHSTLPLWSG